VRNSPHRSDHETDRERGLVVGVGDAERAEREDALYGFFAHGGEKVGVEGGECSGREREAVWIEDGYDDAVGRQGGFY
jgi:hypothetical protein